MTPNIDLGKAILADLDAKKYKDNNVLTTDDGGYDITVGDLRCIIGELLELAAENERLDKIIELQEKHSDKWTDKDDHYWFERLAQEFGELGSSIAGDHNHPVELEIKQIITISINWLKLLAARNARRGGKNGTDRSATNG